MATNKSGRNQIEVPEARKAMDQFKLEVANELGLANYDQVDKGNLTSAKWLCWRYHGKENDSSDRRAKF